MGVRSPVVAPTFRQRFLNTTSEFVTRPYHEDAGKSGKTMKLDGIQEVLSLIKSKQVRAIVVYKLDRLPRSVIDTAKASLSGLTSENTYFHGIYSER